MKQWTCCCRYCGQMPVTDNSAMIFYLWRWLDPGYSEEHLHESTIRHDLKNTGNPVLKKILQWRLDGDPRVIRGK